MISVEEALQLIEKNIPPARIENKAIGTVEGYVLAENLYASSDMPAFNQSAMDGYAFHTESKLLQGDKLTVVGEVKAGDSADIDIQQGEAVRIFTGAFVPPSCNTVVIQENVTILGNELTLDQSINSYDNVRKQGVQIKNNELALTKGVLITPAAVSFIAMLGYAEVKVYAKPRVGIVVTGNELVKPSETLLPGQIYESNSFALAAAAKKHGCEIIEISHVEDNYQSTFEQLKKCIEKVDIMLVSGGISVGDYDFVGKALAEIGVSQVFYKVKQKPGKPLYFGTYQNKSVFALPGNPASALVCFYHYALPMINQFRGKNFVGLAKVSLKSKSNYIRKGDRAIFLKSQAGNSTVEILEGQQSHMMHTFAIANALVYIPASINAIKKDEMIECYVIN